MSEAISGPSQQEHPGEGNGSGLPSIHCTVSIDRDALTAHAVVLGAKGEAVSPSLILDALAAERIIVGIDREAVARLASKNGPRGKATVVARGKPPVHGENAVITYQFDPNPQPQFVKDESGKVNYRESGTLQQVSEGDVLAEITPPTPGVPGVTVTGARIAPKPGRPLFVNLGENVRFADSSGTRIIAETTGCVRMSEIGEISVSETFFVNGDVDFESGNIRFQGNVVIRGDVKAGFSVMAARDVEVYGVVEDSEIYSGGSVTVRGGFVGTGRGTIRCMGEAHLLFIENQKLIVNGDISVGEEIIHSDVQCGGAVSVKFGKGAIIGGKVEATTRIEAKTLGNVHFDKTNLRVGRFIAYEQMREELIRALGQEERIREKMDAAINHLRGMKLSRGAEDKEIEPKLRLLYNESTRYRKLVERLRSRHKDLEKMRLNFEKYAYVQALERIFPGVDVEISDAHYTIGEEMGPKKFILSGGVVNAV